MNRRVFLQGLTGLAGALPRAGRAQGNRPPNIVFILADDLGWGDLGVYGHRQMQTPHLDRLAHQGTLFTQFYVNGSVCSPSRTAFTTGHFPARHRVHGHFAANDINARRGMPNWLDPSVETLPKVLKKAGYATAHFGKWHLGAGQGAPEPKAYGFDDYRTVNAAGPTWDERDPFFRARSTELIVDETLRFAQKNRATPFYVNVWSLLPHALLNPTKEQLDRYPRLVLGREAPGLRSALQIYYASVTALDDAVGRLLARLDEMGLADNTLVLFSSDNGPEDIHILNASHSGVGSAGPFRGRKRSLYEGGVRMPFLVRWPGHVPAKRVDRESVATAVDFLPTLSRIAGTAPPSGWDLDGEDISDILAGKSRPRSKPIFWEWRFNIAGEVHHHSPMLSMREGDWKLLMNPDRSRVELYDIPRDAMELNNLAGGRKEVVARMAPRLLAWQKTLPAGPLDPGAGGNAYPWPGAAAR
jgi:N-acetylgalactosamine-6-sulfatase